MRFTPVINGHADVYNRCYTPGRCVALTNFWRSVSNLTIHVMGATGCRAAGNFWAASQAAPLRRVHITGGDLLLQDHCTAGPQYASGGFIADSQLGFVTTGLQQQYFVRDSQIAGWSNASWNQVFCGVVGAPPQSFASTPHDPPPYTTLPASPVSREKPFLVVEVEVARVVLVGPEEDVDAHHAAERVRLVDGDVRARGVADGSDRAGVGLARHGHEGEGEGHGHHPGPAPPAAGTR